MMRDASAGFGDQPAQPAIVEDELALLARAADHIEKAVRLERLLDEVVGAAPHRLDRDLDIAMPGDHHDGQIRIELLDMAEQRHPVDALHLQVGDDNAIVIGVQDSRSRARQRRAPRPRSRRDRAIG